MTYLKPIILFRAYAWIYCFLTIRIFYTAILLHFCRLVSIQITSYFARQSCICPSLFLDLAFKDYLKNIIVNTKFKLFLSLGFILSLFLNHVAVTKILDSELNSVLLYDISLIFLFAFWFLAMTYPPPFKRRIPK